jgi:hypothetical protein
MALINSTTPVRWRRLLPVAFIAAAGALGGNALAEPAVACAAPNTGGYDDGRYEECRKSGLNPRFCCSQAGGTWTEVRVYDKNGNWVSSYYMCTGSASKPAVSQPPVTRVPPGVIQPLTPETFAPVSVA